MTSKDIKEYGLSIGYAEVGIVSADDLTEYIDEVISRGEKYEFFNHLATTPIQGSKPKEIMPEAKSIIVLVWDYFQYDFPDEIKKMVGKAYLARCYNAPKGTVSNSRFELMKEFLLGNGFKINSDIPIPARFVAAKSGVTTFGKNNFAYADGAGSYIIISTIVVDKELEYDKPIEQTMCPPNCRACIDACPTKALYEPFKLDPEKCISFNNWTRQYGRGNISTFIPYETRKRIGCKIHGCDICQDVCPRNQKKLKEPKKIDKYIELLSKDISLEKILNMSEEYFTKKIKPIMYNYIKDKRYFMRNAAIAIGNTKDEKYIKDLKIALTNPDEMVREYVVWALGEIGGNDAINILEDRLSSEVSNSVINAIKNALEHIKI